MMKMKYEKPIVETIEANAENVLMAGSITGSVIGGETIGSGTGPAPGEADAKGNDGLDIWGDDCE